MSLKNGNFEFQTRSNHLFVVLVFDFVLWVNCSYCFSSCTLNIQMCMKLKKKIHWQMQRSLSIKSFWRFSFLLLFVSFSFVKKSKNEKKKTVENGSRPMEDS